eukprot:s7413_g2.t1
MAVVVAQKVRDTRLKRREQKRQQREHRLDELFDELDISGDGMLDSSEASSFKELAGTSRHKKASHQIRGAFGLRRNLHQKNVAGARHHPPRDPGILPLAPSSDVLRGLPGRLLDKYEPSVKEQPSSTNPPAPSAKCEPIGERARYRGERKLGETPEFKDWREWEGEVVSGHFYTEDLECEPEWPWACTACWAKAEELQSSAIVCAEFMHMVLLGMFD